MGFAPSRWVAFFTFSLNDYFGQDNPFGYHFVNLAIHIGSAITCYWLVLLTFRTPRLADEGRSGTKSALSLVSGLLFLTHPVQTEAVTYIWQRTESLAGFFYLMSLCLYVKFRLGEKAGRQSSWESPLGYYVASCVVAAISAMTKEIVITLPATIILYEIVFFGKVSTRFKRLVLTVTPFLSLLLIVPVLARQSPAVTKNLLYESPSTWSYMLTQVRVAATYLRLLAWPAEQNLDYDFPLSQSILAPDVLLGMLLILSMVILGILAHKSWPLVTFGTIWFFITLSPTSSIVTLPDVIFEHRLYLPLVGFAFVVIGIIAASGRRERILTAVAIIVLVVFSAGTYRRNNTWQNDVALWQDTVKKSPGKARPWVNLAMSYINVAEYDKALEALSQAVVLKPDYAAAYENIGVAHFHKKAYQPAIAAFEKAIALDPVTASAYYALGEAYLRVGEKDVAIRNFEKTLSLNPYHPEARNGLGVILAERGLFSRAIDEFETLLQFDSNRIDASFNLARAYALSGQVDRAVLQYKKVIASEPNFLEAYHNLGILYIDVLKRPDEAKQYFQKALVLTKEPQVASRLKEIISQIERHRNEGGNPHGPAGAAE
jgi:tetratricopeptide (TPR) repeat protein